MDEARDLSAAQGVKSMPTLIFFRNGERVDTIVGADVPGGQTLSEDAAEGTQIGKRYVNEAGDLELLCTKPGKGSLAAGGTALTVKGAKPLPSSD